MVHPGPLRSAGGGTGPMGSAAAPDDGEWERGQELRIVQQESRAGLQEANAANRKHPH